MANPGQYPMGGMQPGGPMPPMGPGGMMPRPPMRQGTSRMVPVVVSAGLAIGVFCGLLFGLGTGKRTAQAEPEKASNNVKKPEELTAPESLANPNVKIDKNPPKAGSGSAVAATGSGSAAPDTAPPAPKFSKLVVEIKPAGAAQNAKVYVDDKEIVGTSIEIPYDAGATKKKIKVVVKSPGYGDSPQEVELEGDKTSATFDLVKVAAAKDTASKDATPTGAKDGGSKDTPRDSGSKDKGTGNKGTGGKDKGTGKGSAKGSGGLIDI